jgi:hypothetical protein
MDESFVLSSPAGRNYGQPDPPQEVAFDSVMAQEFDRYIKTQSTNSRIFNNAKMQLFIWYIEHPNQIPNSDPNSLSNRSFALRYFEVDDGFLYRREELKHDGNGGVFTIPRRYLALEGNTLKFITNIHRLLQHFGIQKTYERVNERCYGITRNEVTWVVNRCTICNLKAAAKDSAPETLIVSSRCLNRVSN